MGIGDGDVRLYALQLSAWASSGGAARYCCSRNVSSFKKKKIIWK